MPPDGELLRTRQTVPTVRWGVLRPAPGIHARSLRCAAGPRKTLVGRETSPCASEIRWRQRPCGRDGDRIGKDGVEAVLMVSAGGSGRAF